MTTTIEQQDAFAAAIRAERESHERWELETVAANVNGRPVTIRELRVAFEKVQNPTHWKLPFTASVPLADLCLTLAAVEHYHARLPQVDSRTDPADPTRIIISGRGYCC